MTHQSFDLFVIGAGSGGVRAARLAAAFGAKVAIAESRDLGGTCVNVGCIPKKLFVYASQFTKACQTAKAFGWSMEPPRFDWTTLRTNTAKEIARLNGVYHALLTDAGTTIIHGHARLIDEHTVDVNGQPYRANKILIASGSWPFIPHIPGREHVLTSNDMFQMEPFPKHLLIAGGGYIALEFSSIFYGLGAQTTLLYRGPLFLRGFDYDLRERMAQTMINAGIDVRFNSTVTRIDKQTDGRLLAQLADGSHCVADAILYATGRHAHIENLGLDTVGVHHKNGTIMVDDHYRTNIDSIYALGDVTGGMQLTPVALAEASAFAHTYFTNSPSHVDYSTIPYAVFCQPSIASCGLTEEQARSQYGSIKVFESDFRPLKHTVGGQKARDYLKWIVDANSDRVIGAHMIGDDAAEIMQGIAIAMNAGATKTMVDHTIGIHPTSAEEWVSMRHAKS